MHHSFGTKVIPSLAMSLYSQVSQTRNAGRPVVAVGKFTLSMDGWIAQSVSSRMFVRANRRDERFVSCPGMLRSPLTRRTAVL